MSTSTHAEASTPQKKMQECRRCKEAGFPNQLIGFEKVGEDPTSGKINWKLINEDGGDHRHRSNNYSTEYYQQQEQNQRPVFKTRRLADITTVTDLQEARNLLSLGWEYKTSYPATIANIPHYVLVKREQYN
jgi:hypothetical protein